MYQTLGLSMSKVIIYNKIYIIPQYLLNKGATIEKVCYIYPIQSFNLYEYILMNRQYIG